VGFTPPLRVMHTVGLQHDENRIMKAEKEREAGISAFENSQNVKMINPGTPLQV